MRDLPNGRLVVPPHLPPLCKSLNVDLEPWFQRRFNRTPVLVVVFRDESPFVNGRSRKHMNARSLKSRQLQARHLREIARLNLVMLEESPPASMQAAKCITGIPPKPENGLSVFRPRRRTQQSVGNQIPKCPV